MTAPYGPYDVERRTGPSEYGGSAGLVDYTEEEGPLGVGKGHELTGGEKLGIANRTSPDDEEAVDPVTGISAVGLE